jgi:hypothetical protein
MSSCSFIAFREASESALTTGELGVDGSDWPHPLKFIIAAPNHKLAAARHTQRCHRFPTI